MSYFGFCLLVLLTTLSRSSRGTSTSTSTSTSCVLLGILQACPLENFISLIKRDTCPSPHLPYEFSSWKQTSDSRFLELTFSSKLIKQAFTLFFYHVMIILRTRIYFDGNVTTWSFWSTDGNMSCWDFWSLHENLTSWEFWSFDENLTSWEFWSLDENVFSWEFWSLDENVFSWEIGSLWEFE